MLQPAKSTMEKPLSRQNRGPPGPLGGRNNPEPSGAGAPYSPMSYQDGYGVSAFPAAPMSDDSTDSETSSDNDSEELPDPGVSQMSQAEAAEHIYMQYRKARRTWRRFTDKPVRKF